jgi:hypothetical protein
MVTMLMIAAAVLTCNTAEELSADSAMPYSSHGGGGGFLKEPPLRSAPLTLLPQDKGNESPACLDGSPYGFYFNPSKSGKSTKWTISIEGGGWCYDEDGCYNRSLMRLGSSKSWGPTAGCGCMNTDDNGIDEDCNCLYMPYGDGASFSGYRPEPWPVPTRPGKFLTFRGIKNLDATLDWAFEHGLDKATEFVLTGGSAGGLSTFLHADRVAARVRKAAPAATRIVAAPVVGYFLDHDNYRHTTGTPNTPTWKQANYTTWMRYIYQMQNLTFGADGGLTAACERLHPLEPGLCFMSPHVVSVIQTPLFVFNSKYDAWQLANEFQSGWVDKGEQDGVIQYGKDFMSQFAAVQASPKNGAFITSCICHGCPWHNSTALSIDDLTVDQHYAAWMTGKTTGAASIHIDTRLPNGGGAITDRMCSSFPNQLDQKHATAAA